MSEPFDPYYCWLGIPPEHQPPHYYRLLGIEPLEPSADVIEAAADRQMAHLRTYQTGRHAELSQDLLNEVAAAKLMLLNPEKKAAYDRALRNELAMRPHTKSGKRLPTAEPLSPEPEPPLPRPPISRVTSPEVQTSIASARSRGRKPPWMLAAAIGAGALLVIVLLIVLLSRNGTPPVAQGEGQPPLEVEEPAGVEESAGPPAPSDPAPSTEDPPEVPGAEPEVPAAPPAPQEPADAGTGSEHGNPPGPPAEAEPDQPGESPAAPARDEGSLADLLEPDEEPSATPGGRPELGPPEPGPPNLPRDPVPDQAAQQEALVLIREIFKEDYDEATTLPGKAALAAKMLQQVNQPGTDAVARFVLLRVARDVAAEAGDVETAFWAIDQMAAGYAVDPAPMRFAAWLRAAEAANLPEHRKALAEHSIPLIREAVAQDDYQTAERVADLGTKAAQRIRDTELVRQIVALQREAKRIERAYEAIQPALATLKSNPNDPEANLAAGKFFCLVKEDWGRGLSMLALGSDSPYQAPARKELEEISSPQEQIALGDAWWDLAQTREGSERDLLLRHARDWYRRVQPNVTRALDRLKIETRLTEVGKIDRPEGGPPTADGLAIWNAHNHKFKDRGALACDVLLRRGQITVWEKRNVRLKWGNTVDPVTLVQLPKVPFDTLRVEITKWYWVGGALSEIEVYRGRVNLARGRPVRASGSRDSRYPAGKLTDGVTQSGKEGGGFWLAPDKTAAWIEIDFPQESQNQ